MCEVCSTRKHAMHDSLTVLLVYNCRPSSSSSSIAVKLTLMKVKIENCKTCLLKPVRDGDELAFSWWHTCNNISWLRIFESNESENVM